MVSKTIILCGLVCLFVATYVEAKPTFVITKPEVFDGWFFDCSKSGPSCPLIVDAVKSKYFCFLSFIPHFD